MARHSMADASNAVVCRAGVWDLGIRCLEFDWRASAIQYNLLRVLARQTPWDPPIT
jgi:hypothetical protein